ncbi:hypothetical protein MUY27_19165 [Mucilaginibacter sp. RS28]|uniref:Uncharacterized protein n=1 Tax=Mucilaginibacter straminoryzae TaxID=2932774 RepID=A0A9X2BEW1_9SPHI|nr:hypothetical protein [Mucilaginibacter straminoryzae]MCJ8211848.1 hypothetical protein [Mucilaginibacter straminoryzae]
MRKTIAILLVVLHLFYAGGYTVLFQYLVNRADEQVENQILAGNYKEKDLIEIKVPVHTPYSSTWSSYQEVSGQMHLKGATYNYVKLKVTPDTLFLKCIPNQQSTKLMKENIRYAKQVGDQPFNKKGAGFKQLQFDNFYFPAVCWKIKSPVEIYQPKYNLLSVNAYSSYFQDIEQPPCLA